MSEADVLADAQASPPRQIRDNSRLVMLTSQDPTLHLRQSVSLTHHSLLRRYLIVINAVDPASGTASIMYTTGESEENINLSDICREGHMSICTGPNIPW